MAATGPPGRETVSIASSRSDFPTRWSALCKRRPRHLSFLFSSGGVHPSSTHKREERQNRRAPGTATGEKSDFDESLLSEVAGFSPATGDSWSPVVLPPISATAFQAQLPPLYRLCVLCGSWVGCVWICVHLRYLRFLRDEESALIRLICRWKRAGGWTWCLGGSPGWAGGSGSIWVICGQIWAGGRLCALC